MDVEVTVESNRKEYENALDEAIEKMLTECGIRAEELAAGICPVDTGLLRNSITFALDGESAKKGRYKADRGDRTGSYDGQAPKERGGNRAVYIGTNVEYAPHIEIGSTKRKPKPFLKPAIEDHKDEYREIAVKNLQGRT